MPTYHRRIILASNFEFEGKLFKLDYSHTQPNLDIHEPVWAARPDLTKDFFFILLCLNLFCIVINFDLTIILWSINIYLI